MIAIVISLGLGISAWSYMSERRIRRGKIKLRSNMNLRRIRKSLLSILILKNHRKLWRLSISTATTHWGITLRL